MTSEGTALPVQPTGDHVAPRPGDTLTLPTSGPAPPVHEEGTLFGAAEEDRPATQRNSGAVVFAPRPSSGIQPSHTSVEKHDADSTNNSTQELFRNEANQGLGANSQPLQPFPPRFQEDSPGLRRQRTGNTRRSTVQEWSAQPNAPEKLVNLADRLQPTIDHAVSERDKYALKAKWTGWVLNAAIGLQVLLGSLTTGLSAVATTGRSAAVNTTILGALATIVASYLARARGSNEPELSIARTKDLDQFIRECEAFKLDYGHVTTGKYDNELNAKRKRFEELLGNANGERKLAPPA